MNVKDFAREIQETERLLWEIENDPSPDGFLNRAKAHALGLVDDEDEVIRELARQVVSDCDERLAEIRRKLH